MTYLDHNFYDLQLRSFTQSTQQNTRRTKVICTRDIQGSQKNSYLNSTKIVQRLIHLCYERKKWEIDFKQDSDEECWQICSCDLIWII